jgi:hypothetical protein
MLLPSLHHHPVVSYTSPSYSDKADTIVSSRLLPSYAQIVSMHLASTMKYYLTLNSAISRLPFSSLSIILKIFFTLFSGVSSSSGNLTILPTIL